MSSPSNIIVVITHLPMSMEEFSLVATDFYQKWRENVDEGHDGRLYHTDRALESFWNHACTGKGFVEGAEGETFAFGNAGNYVNVDDFIGAIEPFIRELVWRHVYTSATIMHQPHDCGFTWYKLDAARLASKAPNLKLGVQRKFEAFPFMSFDVDISKVYTSAIKDPVQGPVEPMSPEVAKNIEDLNRALSAGYQSVPGVAEAINTSVVGFFPPKLKPATAVKEVKAPEEVGPARKTCQMCKEGHGARCAFIEAGAFISDNWNCGIMNQLRTLGDDTFYAYPPAHISRSNDQTCVTIPFNGKFIVLGWYKQRGRTEAAYVMHEFSMLPLDLATAEECVRFYKAQSLEEI